MRRARRSVVQWSGRASNASLGHGNPHNPKKTTKKKSGGEKRAAAAGNTKNTRRAQQYSVRIEQVSNGWRARCGCGWTATHGSKSKAHGAAADHTHLAKTKRPSPAPREKSPARRDPVRPAGTERAPTDTPDARTKRRAMNESKMKVKKEGSRWLWWCIDCGEFQKGVPSESAARHAADRHHCKAGETHRS